MTLPAPLAPLALYPQWIIYRLEPDSRNPAKRTKIPCDPRTGRMFPAQSGGAMLPAHHVPYDQALAAAASCDVGYGSGVGFVFTAADPFWFLDIDGAFQADQWSPLATELYQTLTGAAWEVSQSGTGLHAIGSGTIPDHGCRNVIEGLELYHQDRFVALTAQAYPGGSVMADLSAPIANVAARWFPPTASTSVLRAGWTTEPAEGWDTTLSDDADLIRRACANRTTNDRFGAAPGGTPVVTFSDLWEARADALGAKWPPDKHGSYNASHADAALASHLSFWTGRNCERIESLMRQSALVRDKWDRPGYLNDTILNAVAVSSSYATPRAATVAPAESAPDPEAAIAVLTGVPFGTFIPPAAYPDWFAGCVFVKAHDKVYTPKGDLLGATTFDTVYGGKRFILDAEGAKSTASAWEAFRLCQLSRPPIADALCFRPEEPAGQLIASEGRLLLNTYVPIETHRIAADPARFLDLMKRILPVERDRTIVLSYMAAMVQYPGAKFQWWPVIQGTRGNGKTALLRCLSHAVGHRYTHLVDPSAMAKTGNQFNKWITGNLFVGIEEIYLQNRRDFLDSFKPYVTNDRVPMEGKGADQVTADNRCNGLMLTNHRDAIPLDIDERRYAIFYTAQQCNADIERDGMGGSYFPDLYHWFKGDGAYAELGTNYGYAVVAEYLSTYQIAAEFNPAGLCHRAPTTSSTAVALMLSRGHLEQEVQEAIDEGRTGFAGGWVSSGYLALLLDHLRVKMTHVKRREMMQTLGYDWHPALDQGRTNNPVPPDGRKVRLYVRAGHLALNLTDHAAIAKAYSSAQQSVADDNGARAKL